MRVFRIAVCLSGQARTWRTCVESIKGFFGTKQVVGLDVEHRVEVDYFGHTWDHNIWRGGKSEIVAIPASELAEIAPAYAMKAMQIDKLRPSPAFRTWDGLFYSHMRAMHLKRQYEIENHFEYDLVVKARFDTVYGPVEFPATEPHPLVCYTNMSVSKFLLEQFHNDFHDVIFFGDSPTMDIVATFHQAYEISCTLSNVEALSKRAMHPGHLRLGPGTLLYRFLVDRNIHPQTAGFDYTVVREEAMKRGLDPIRDYALVRDIYLGWTH